MKETWYRLGCEEGGEALSSFVCCASCEAQAASRAMPAIAASSRHEVGTLANRLFSGWSNALAVRIGQTWCLSTAGIFVALCKAGQAVDSKGRVCSRDCSIQA